ncbi:DUF1707 domain-containing protein [Streptomyces sp. YIM 121038]|uniref:DUF1707 SHOCT-like domain-containing protein n=1 Tax=Streptomyces sp. YIM 121038 TaxID=2136401 RepID=UPI001110EB25|nr:DUF1707 domain-containing protein [Streptomyces sp. YIM 121038]
MSAGPSTLIGDGDREAAATRLQEAYADGYIAHEEMDDRLQRALTARTREDLAAALASLPEPAAEAASTISAGSGRIKRRGAWRVPRTLKVASAFGKVHLDLSRAVIEHPVVDIELALGSGRAKITVPRDAIVDIGALQAGWKAPRYTAPRRTAPGGPTIRISGAMGFGRLKVRHARR